MTKTLRLLVLLLVLCCLGSCQLTNFQAKYGNFTSYKKNYDKTYNSEADEKYRIEVYLDNLKKYEDINNDKSNTYEAGVSHFSDMTQKEFEATYLSPKSFETSSLTTEMEDFAQLVKDMKEINWVLQNKTTPVKNQGRCGASWAFAAIAAVESLLKNNSFIEPDLSQQQLIDCATLSGSGCDSGSVQNALEYIRVSGITLQLLYPYALSNPGSRPCRHEIKGMFKIAGHNKTEGCPPLVTALGRTPVAVAVDARTWHFYRNGILNKCGATPNYATLMVGVTMKYWIVKTSFGERWGEKGYIKMVGQKNCGLVCKGGIYPV